MTRSLNSLRSQEGPSTIIVAESAGNLKRFIERTSLSEVARRMVLRMVLAFIMHRGRMSCSQAAGSVASEAAHRAQITRFPARPRWQHDDFNAPCVQRYSGWKAARAPGSSSSTRRSSANPARRCKTPTAREIESGIPSKGVGTTKRRCSVNGTLCKGKLATSKSVSEGPRCTSLTLRVTSYTWQTEFPDTFRSIPKFLLFLGISCSAESFGHAAVLLRQESPSSAFFPTTRRNKNKTTTCVGNSSQTETPHPKGSVPKRILTVPTNRA